MNNLVKTEAWVGIVEDILDLVMLLGSLVYIFVINETSMELSPETLAAIGGTGGTLRLLLRRILRRIVEVRLANVAAAAAEAAEALPPSEEPTADAPAEEE